MADCGQCEREQADPVRVAVNRCAVCNAPICRHHQRRQDGRVLCKRDAKEERRALARAISDPT